jgi:predicted PurR-regulated permease PerM
LPAAAQKIRAQWATREGAPATALEKVQDAARELEKTAAASNPAAPPPTGVERVEIVQPAFRATDYVWWTSIGAILLAGQAALVLILAYFLLVYDDLFKRKLVENIGPRLTHKKLTVQILNDIASQIELVLFVQILTCVLVGVVTGLGLWWMGLRQPCVWGVAAGVLNIVPYIGPLVVATGLGIVGYLQFEAIAPAAGVMAFAFLITTIEGYWLTPALLGRLAQINRIALFAGILFWSWLCGVPGMLLAIPMMVVLKAVCDGVEDGGKLETIIEDLDLPNPVIRSYYRDGSIKQYVRDHLLLRTEPTSNNVTDFGVPKALAALPQLRQAMGAVIDRYLTIQQDILETFVDRGQLRQLAEPTRFPSGRRIPGLKLDHPRQLALMHALVRFAHIAASDTFTTHERHSDTAAAFDLTPDQYRVSSLRYELSKLRAKGLVERVTRSRRYRLLPQGYRICLIFLKLFERVYAPLTAGLLRPVTADVRLPDDKRHQLDRLYQRLVNDLDALLNAVGLKTAA